VHRAERAAFAGEGEPMIGTRVKIAVGGALILLTVGATTAGAGGGVQRAQLDSFKEVPTLATGGTGAFSATVNTTTDRIRYTLRYSGMSARVQQAHIHLGRPAIAGGISAWLCDSAATPGPAGTPACPARRGTVQGVIAPADVLGPTAQGIGAGQFNALVRTVRNNATYVNVHTVAFPPGEIRGQIN
jgi:CHRD domain